MTIHYQPKLGVAALRRFKSTVLHSTLLSFTFWSLLVLHALFMYLNEYYEMRELEWSSVQPLLSLATFFLVFYTGECYSRFYQLHYDCIGILGAMLDWTSDVKLHFPSDKTLQWNLCRLMLCSLQITFFSLDEKKMVDGSQWDSMQSNNLISAEEIEVIKEFRGFKPFLPIVWALDEARAHTLERKASVCTACAMCFFAPTLSGQQLTRRPPQDPTPAPPQSIPRAARPSRVRRCRRERCLGGHCQTRSSSCTSASRPTRCATTRATSRSCSSSRCAIARAHCNIHVCAHMLQSAWTMPLAVLC